MKAVKIILGILTGVYAVAQVVNLTLILMHGTGDAYQAGRLTGCVVGLIIGGAISIACFKSASNY